MQNNKPRVHKKYDEAFKRAVVDNLLTSKRPVKEVADEFGVSVWNLRDWSKRFGPQATPKSPSELEEENRRLRQELFRVQQQRDILKKTLGILATPPHNDSNG
jgi:transposase